MLFGFLGFFSQWEPVLAVADSLYIFCINQVLPANYNIHCRSGILHIGETYFIVHLFLF